jgi:hypothetical protein
MLSDKRGDTRKMVSVPTAAVANADLRDLTIPPSPTWARFVRII